LSERVKRVLNHLPFRTVGKKAVLRYLRECGKFEPELLGDGDFKEKAVAIATPLLQAAVRWRTLSQHDLLTSLDIQLDQQEENEDPDIVQKSRAKKRKSQPDVSDEEMQDVRPTKKARPSVSKKEKDKVEEEGVSMSDAEDAKPPPKKAEPKSTSAAESKKTEPASPPKTPVNKKRAAKPRKKRPDSDKESEDGKIASTPPVLKVSLKVIMF
jgi:hypothetical protein